MKIGEARAIVGSLSRPSKMPGTAWSVPISACRTGSVLAEIEGSVCSLCYAGKDFYRTPNALAAHAMRLRSIDHPLWVAAMVRLLRQAHRKPIRCDLGAVGVRLQKKGGSRFVYKDPGWHRWFDAGDLQSVEHLAKICDVARRTPTIRHWLPTQELSMVRAYLRDGRPIPSNLTIRVSSVMIDDEHRRNWSQTSSVFRKTPPANAHICPAPTQGHVCGSCRACWDRKVEHVAYHLH